jgi:1-acyl-sn-glycerol-3-phosphate acyltransferase
MRKAIARGILKLVGWKTILIEPEEKRYVIIAAPHTSNWDFPLGILFMLTTDINFKFMVKDALFKCPIKYLFESLGGIDFDRKNSNNLTGRIANYIKSQDEVALALAPEGTRSKIEYWKSGFYYIALEAGVPIGLAGIDYGTKTLSLKKTIMPTGDIEADMEIIRNYYKDIKPKHPEKEGPIRIKPR